MKIAAQTISWVFLPLFMPIYGLLIAMYIPSLEESFFQEETMYWLAPFQKVLILSMYFVFSVLVPGISLLIMRNRNQISTIEMDDKSERKIPIVITAIYCAFLGIILLVRAPNGVLPDAIYALPWGGFVSIVLAGFITKYDKISLHALGAGMLFGFLIAYYQTQLEFSIWPIIASAVISGLVMSSRMYLQKHNLFQSISGFLLGGIVMFLIIFIFPSL
jgi:membrane-associated phospholipid phosphatase